MKKFFIILVLIISSTNTNGYAQWEVGGSFELRNEDPQSGFGLQVQRSFLNKIVILDTRIRAHFSYFDEENKLQTSEVNLSRDFKSFDYGIDAITGFSIGLVEPYAGLGLGAETFDFKAAGIRTIGGDGVQNVDEDNTETNLFWNITVGAKISPIPVIKPFVEYRFVSTEISKPDFAPGNNERIIFGVLLSF